jgi:hypothetical protein
MSSQQLVFFIDIGRKKSNTLFTSILAALIKARRRGRPRKNPEQTTPGVAGKETGCLAKVTRFLPNLLGTVTAT